MRSSQGGNGVLPYVESDVRLLISVSERQITLPFVILGWSPLALDIFLDLSSFLIPSSERSSLFWGLPFFSTGKNRRFLHAVPNYGSLLIQDHYFLLAFLAAQSTRVVGQRLSAVPWILGALLNCTLFFSKYVPALLIYGFAALC